MPELLCVDWYEDDDACVAKEAGWSLHLTAQDAALFLQGRASPDLGFGEPRAVEVPDVVFDEVRRSARGVYSSSPRECPYPSAPREGERPR